MTGNQVSYASVQVSKQIADETERHNREVENETLRHNTETESINRLTNDLQQQRINNDYWIESERNRLTAQYNDLWAAAQKADVSEREWYHQMMTSIEQDKVHAEQVYKEESIRIQQNQNSISLQLADENKRHNAKVEEIQQIANSITKFGKDIEAKRLEYQARQWETENWLSFERYGLQLQELGLKERQEQHQYSLGLMEAEIKSASNLLRKEELGLQERKLNLDTMMINQSAAKLPYEIDLLKAHTVSNYWGAVNDTTSNLLKGLNLFTPSFLKEAK